MASKSGTGSPTGGTTDGIPVNTPPTTTQEKTLTPEQSELNDLTWNVWDLGVEASFLRAEVKGTSERVKELQQLIEENGESNQLNRQLEQARREYDTAVSNLNNVSHRMQVMNSRIQELESQGVTINGK